MNFLKKIIITLFLITFGLSSALIRREIIIKSSFTDLNSNFFNLLLDIDFFVGLIQPLFIYTFYIIIFSSSSYIIRNSKIINLSELIMYSLFPMFLFSLINYYYLSDLSFEDIKNINDNQSESIIPFLSYDSAKNISNILYLFPPFIVLLYLKFKEKESLLNSLLISIFPILVIFLIYSFF